MSLPVLEKKFAKEIGLNYRLNDVQQDTILSHTRARTYLSTHMDAYVYTI